jgi:phospholipid N-methyltransferase
MLHFLQEAMRNMRATGSVLPSSPALAAAMTRMISEHDGCKRVLEVGAGTGAFTGAILHTLDAGDVFDIVELNPSFCAHLESKLLRPFRARQPSASARVHQSAIEDSQLTDNYDFIVCGLPFNNFPLPLTESIFAQMLDLLQPGGVLSFFEFFGVRAVKRPFADRAQRDAMNGLEAFQARMAHAHSVRREMVMANIPPATAVHITKAEKSPSTASPCSASTKTT